MNATDFINAHVQKSIAVLSKAMSELEGEITLAARNMIQCLENGGRILVCGNGGSASDALHFSAELLNRYCDERKPLAAIALNADVATLTAIANDYHYDDVFAKQIAALGRPKDILLAITTSGNSGNIVKAQERARVSGLTTVLLTGRGGGACARQSGPKDIILNVSDDSTAHIQETHGVIIHCLCALIEQHFIDCANTD